MRSSVPGAPAPPHPRLARILAHLAGYGGLIAVLAIGWLALTQPGPPAQPGPTPDLGPEAGAPDASAPPGSGRPCGPAGDGYLRGPIFGALALAADWAGPQLLCDGGVRPGDTGVRLFFAAPVDGARIVVMIGIDGKSAELPGGERPANVTVIDERDGRFFSSGGSGRCWVDEIRISAPPMGDPGNDPKGQWLSGRLYCAGALPALADRSSVTLGDIRFAGRFSRDAD
jgi:hypothetical protein